MKRKNVSGSIAAILIICFALSACGSPQSAFDVYGNDAKAWAGKFDKNDPGKLTVLVEQNGTSSEPQSITDKDAINAVFEAISALRINGSIELGEGSVIEDARTVTYTFTSAGGSSMAFTFINDNLACGDPQRANGILYSCAGLNDLFSIEGIDLSVQGGVQPNDPGAPDEGTSVFTSEKQGFSFSYDSSYSTEWEDEDGAYVYTETDGSIPYLLVWLISSGENDGFAFDPVNFFYFNAEEMKENYGSRLKSCEDAPSEYSIAGKTLFGAKYVYELDGYTIEAMVFLDATDDHVSRYTCKYVQGNGEATMAALELAVSTFSPGGDAVGNTPVTSDMPQNTDTHALGGYRIEAAKPIISGTTKYDGGFFSVDLPIGWQIQTMGQYNTFGFRAWDPNDTDYEIFYYGSLNPFNKSEAAKQWNKSNAGYGFPYDIYGDAPVVAQDNASELFCVWNDFADTVAKYTGIAYQAGFSFPELTNFAVIESLPVSTYFADIATDEALVRGSFKSSLGTDCLAKCCASIYSVGTYNYGGVDMLPLSALSVSGVLAPQDGFAEVEQILSDCIYSLSFTDSYVSEAQYYIKKTAEGYMAANAALRAAYDSYNAAWSARQTSYDIISQKNSDVTLGYDRLYDPDTGEVYRAELGFYDSYDIDRDRYSNPNLQIIDGNTENYYLNGVDYYIYK